MGDTESKEEVKGVWEWKDGDWVRKETQAVKDEMAKAEQLRLESEANKPVVHDLDFYTKQQKNEEEGIKEVKNSENEIEGEKRTDAEKLEDPKETLKDEENERSRLIETTEKQDKKAERIRRLKSKSHKTGKQITYEPGEKKYPLQDEEFLKNVTNFGDECGPHQDH